MNTSLMQPENYVTWSGGLGSPGRRWNKPGGAAENDIIMAEPWCINSIHDQLTMTITVDNKCERVKGAMEGQKF